MSYDIIGWSSNKLSTSTRLNDYVRCVIGTCPSDGYLTNFYAKMGSFTENESIRGAIYVSSTKALVAQTDVINGDNTSHKWYSATFGPSSVSQDVDYLIVVWGDENSKSIYTDNAGEGYWYNWGKDFSASSNGNFSLYLDPIDFPGYFNEGSSTYSIQIYVEYQVGGSPPTPPPPPGEAGSVGGDLYIYYNSLTGDDYILTKCSRWDVDNYSVVVEFWLKKSDLITLRSNITPQAVGELYTILGRPKYYDKTWSGGNTIKLIPNSDSHSNLKEMRSETTIYVKNITDTPLPGDSGWINVKIEGLVSNSGDL